MARGIEIHLVRADAEAADSDQTVRRREDLRGQLGAGADAQQVNALNGLDQCVLVERGLEIGEVGVAGGLDQFDSTLVHALQQKNADLVFLEGVLL